MTIKCVVFDLGRVLVDWDPRHLYRQLMDDEAEMEHFLTTVCTMEWHTEHDRGVSFKDNADRLVSDYPEHEALIRAWGDRWPETIKSTIDGSVQLARRLMANGYTVVGLTNCPDDGFDDLCATWGIFEGFDDVVVSGREKLVKPDPAIFHLTLERAGHPAEAVAFLDDSLRNVEAARALGIHAIHFHAPDQAAAALQALGVKTG